MLLRTRITIMVSSVVVALVLALTAESNWRTGMARDEMDRALLQGQRSAWRALQDNALQPLDRLARAAARDGGLTAALGGGDGVAAAAIMKRLQAEAGSGAATASLELAAADGRGILGGGGDAILSPAALAAARGRGGPVAGLWRSASGFPVLGVVMPLYSRAGFVGAAGFAFDPLPVVKGVSTTLGSAVALTLAGSPGPVASDERWAAAAQRAGHDEAVGQLLQDGRRLKLATITVPLAVEGQAASLVSMTDVTASQRRSLWLSLISMGGVLSGTMLFVGFLHWYMRQSFSPLNRVIQLLNRLARGERATVAFATGRQDEIGRLAATADSFRAGLDARDQLLKLRQDMDAAHGIQASILPAPLAPRGDIALQAFMRAAREVGGDFFDYFDLPDGRFGFVIADVSGKGMAAALFMAVACTVIRSTARLVEDPGDCLSRANDMLAANNEQSMFVTVFYGILCPRTGRLVYANGGHNPPYRVGAAGRVEALPKTKGKLLALFPGRGYATGELTLSSGDALFLFTDGVTEAQDAHGTLFGEKRLEQALADAPAEPQDLMQRVLDRVAGFVGEAPQADDITCLALRWQTGAVSFETPRKLFETGGKDVADSRR